MTTMPVVNQPSARSSHRVALLLLAAAGFALLGGAGCGADSDAGHDPGPQVTEDVRASLTDLFSALQHAEETGDAREYRALLAPGFKAPAPKHDGILSDVNPETIERYHQLTVTNDERFVPGTVAIDILSVKEHSATGHLTIQFHIIYTYSTPSQKVPDLQDSQTKYTGYYNATLVSSNGRWLLDEIEVGNPPDMKDL